MPLFVDVALPVPLERAFTYSVNGADAPAVGARVLVPFSGQRLMGVVIRVHSVQPTDGFEIKPVQQVLDDAALLPDELMKLAEWIAQYYVAPLGEVLRGMLPLNAEIRRTLLYRIAEQGRRVLYEGAAKGSSRRSKLTPEDQNKEYAVLNALESGGAVKLTSLRSSTGANKALLEGMVKKRWLTREVEADERDARRLEKIAVLVDDVRLPKLNDNQMKIMVELSAVGGRLRVQDLRSFGVPQSTLATLVKRGLVRVEEATESFHLGGVHAPGKKHAHEHALNETQTEALAGIAAAMSEGGFKPHLLYGITGSGKTAVYFAAMRRMLDAGKASLLLVPEIGLTPAMAGQMHAAFSDEVALLHSQLSPDERAEQWHRIRRGEARIVVGTRSAVFAPVPALGLIIVDEEHDGSYKQEETPRYNGRDVAVMRAKLLGIPVVLGSATPSLESWNNAQNGRYALLKMEQRVMDRPLPAVELVDMRAEFAQTGAENIFSRRLIEETQATLDRGEQAIILLNRRGYSYVVMCRACGDKIECENCAIAMTFHKPVVDSDLHAEPGERLECHYCGYRRTVPKTCPKCQSEHLYYMGAGSQQGEERLQEIFPAARIGRMDRDTVRGRGDMERLLQRLHSGEINLLVGTQMIAKGHDIHGVTTVGVVGCDHALGMPDFRAAERVFQLLTQVSGRAGRGDLPGKVLVQSYHPDHYAVRMAAEHDYLGFARREMQFRRPFFYPPFGVLANVLVQSQELNEALAWSGQLGRWFAGRTVQGVRVLGPAAAPVARLKRIYRFHLLLKAQRRSDLQAGLRAMLQHAEAQGIPRKALVVDVDAISLM
ncbi:replication restart DNA helicase PriA [Terriglobus roseus DSM 18391]|uniref:Replication restart protein PriA n=1 Tax=Terriglobus roseus (strain DSM 18391 / NRRL B-41598 / KBS 63) TaxID=926566 RepID=I3ZIB9_TERRK|nr:primosomal protein N' [Terriglobus roseus]AFL88987.1 replication restart DNA helicase PriA [Terriglobus roseus DSM 18391]